MKTAIAYYRYSSHKQGEQSIEGQAHAAQAWATANGYTIIKEYADRAVSGRTDDREEFQLMLKELDRFRPEVLILWKVDRMGRNREEVAINKYRCKKAGTKVVYTAESIPDSPEGVILESVLEGMAEYYSLQLSQNIRRGQRLSAEKCQSVGGTTPMGYCIVNKHYEIDPGGAAVVQEIFRRYLSGESQAKIARSLNEQGSRSTAGRPWKPESIRRILTNEKYTGVYIYDGYRVPGGMPQIIDTEDFKKVQDMAKIRKRMPAHEWDKTEYLLTGKLFCGQCGERMVGVSGRSKSGAKHNYYACMGRKKHICNKNTVRQSWIEGLIMQCIFELLHDRELLEYIAHKTYQYYLDTQDASYADLLRSDLHQTETALKNLLRAIEMGIITDETRERMEELSARKKELLSAIEVAQAQPKVTEKMILHYLMKFRTQDISSPDIQRHLINIFVNAIYLYDDGRVTITFHYTDNSHPPLSKSELEAIPSVRISPRMFHQA